MLKLEIKTIEVKLSEFEESYNMSSDSFYQEFNEGKLAMRGDT